MNLFELFRQKQIHITPEIAVTVSFITVQRANELYSFAEGDLLLVKRQLTPDDANWLLNYSGKCQVFTLPPSNLEALDAQKNLTGFLPVHLLKTIGMNFIHYGDVLYLFDELMDADQSPETPNVVMLYPVHRKEIETQLFIDLETLMAALGADRSKIDQSETSIEASVPPEGNRPEEKPVAPTEIDFVRKRLCDLFSARYSVVRVEFSGTAPESKTIPLSSFYEKHGIAQGRLKGSWSLFEKEKVRESLDAGIVNRAKEAELKELTVSIPVYGRIIRSNDLETLHARMDGIADDFRAYLNGSPDCKKVGSISIQQSFSPKAAVEESFSKLAAYLHSLSPIEESYEHYHDSVERFIRDERLNLFPFSSKVDLQTVSTTFTENQWSSLDFLYRFIGATYDNPNFFAEDFLNLLNRYAELLNKNNCC